MYTDIDLGRKTYPASEFTDVIGKEQLQNLRLELAYSLGKGEYDYRLNYNILELINDYELLLDLVDFFNSTQLHMNDHLATQMAGKAD